MGLTRPRAYQIFDIDYKQSVRVISITNVTLTGGAPSSVDGVNLSVGDRILVTGQSTGSQNGLYQVSVLGTGSDGTWIRSVDANQTGEIDAGMIVMVTEGETYKDTQWKLTTNDPITIGVTALTFEQNSAFAFGNIYANGTAVLADIVGDTVTFTPANNLIITANATSDTVTFEVSQSPDFTGNFVVSGTVGSNLIPTANITYNLGNATNRWNDIWLSNSTIYLGNAEISANATAITITNPAGGTTVLSGTTPAVEADTVTATGNITGGNLSTSGTLSVTGNANTGNLGATTVVATNLTGTLTTAAQPNVTSVGTLTSLSVTGNVTGGNLITAGQLDTNNFVISGNVTGNLLPSSNVTYNLGSPTQRWNEIFLAGNTIDIGGATISADLVTGSLILTGPDGAEFILSGSDADNALGAFGFISAGNTEPATSTTTGAITSAGGLGVAGNIYAGGLVEVTGNVEGGNLITAGQVTATGNITAGNITASGNVTAAYIIGNVSQASGIFTTKIFNGNSEANIVSSGGNLEISIGGVDDIVTVTAQGLQTTGTLTATGNITGGNISTAGVITATGNVTGGNLVTTGNIVAGNLQVSGIEAVTTLNVSGDTTIVGNLTVSGTTITANVSSLVVTDPILGLGRGANGDPLTSNDGLDRGIEMFYYNTAERIAFMGFDNSAGKMISAANASIANNLVTVNSYGTTVVGTLEAEVASVTGNITGGNLVTAGIVSATGNFVGVGAVFSGNVSANNFIGNLSGTANVANFIYATESPDDNVTYNIPYLSPSGAANAPRSVYSDATGITFNPGTNILTVGTISATTITVGTLNATTAIDLGDNDILRLGASDDWEMYHSAGSDNFMDLNTGNLLIRDDGTVGDPTRFTFGRTTGLFTATGNVTGGNLITEGLISATGNITGGNLSGTSIAGTLTTAVQTNITSVGTLDSLAVTGNITGGNLSGTLVTGTLSTAAQPNVTSLGTLISLTVSGNVTGGNLDSAGQVTVTGNVTGGNINSNGVVSATGNVRAGGNLIAVGYVLGTGNVSGSNLNTAGIVSATGNVTGGNIVTAGQVAASGNVTGNFFNGNGSALTGINAFGTIVVAGADNVVADSTSDTLTLVAGEGVVITTAAGTDTITISTSGSSESIFITGGDMGTVTEAVTQEQDLGVITDPTALEIEMGFIVVAGVLYPDQLVLPSYTVAQLANLSVIPAGQFVYCSNESGGSIPAFSDGTNWRRVTDRAIVT